MKHYPIYGLGIPTPIKFTYKNCSSFFATNCSLFDKEPLIENEDGDGTLPLKSLKYGDYWNTTILLEGYQIYNADHNTVLWSDKTFNLISYILEI